MPGCLAAPARARSAGRYHRSAMPVPPSQQPFAVFLHRAEQRPDGSFRPDARLTVTPALRTSGLLLRIPAEDLRTLLLMLTFLHPNGNVQPSVTELAAAMRVPQAVARHRLRQLANFKWQDRPVVHELRRESGLDAFTPSPRILGTETVAEVPHVSPPPILAAGRDAVLAHSRATYARPRQEVEDEIAQRNGWRPIGAAVVQEDASETVRRLQAIGIGRFEAAGLVEEFGEEKVNRQMDWLPLRGARDPARYLVAAVRGGYAPPREAIAQSTIIHTQYDKDADT